MFFVEMDLERGCEVQTRILRYCVRPDFKNVAYHNTKAWTYMNNRCYYLSRALYININSLEDKDIVTSWMASLQQSGLFPCDIRHRNWLNSFCYFHAEVEPYFAIFESAAICMTIAHM